MTRGEHEADAQLAHHLGGGRDLVDGLALHAQRDHQAGDLHRRGLAGHDLVHDRVHLLAAQIMTVDGAGNGFANVHGVFGVPG
jgi:hypothetical protein